MISQLKLATSCLRLSQNTRHYFATLKLSNNKNFCFPYNFSGTSKSENAQHDQLYDVALSQIYEIDVREGFKFAYKSTLEALVQKDIEFFEEICERNLLNEIKEGYDSLESFNYKLQGQSLDKDDVVLTFDSLKMIYGVKHARRENQSENDYMKREMNFNGVDMVVYQAKTIDPRSLMQMFPFLQVGCKFESSAKILLKDSDGNTLAGNDTNKCHRLVFESVNESQGKDGINHIQNLAQSMSGLFGAVGLFANKGAMKDFLQRLFTTKDLTWKIVDIDDHLKGNPFTK